MWTLHTVIVIPIRKTQNRKLIRFNTHEFNQSNPLCKVYVWDTLFTWIGLDDSFTSSKYMHVFSIYISTRVALNCCETKIGFDLI